MPEFAPVNNIHIGIVTSSLGDHGANTLCTPGALTYYTDASGQNIPQPPDVNDMGHLIGTLDRASAVRADPQSTYAQLNALGFLSWGDATLPTPGVADLTAATKILTDMVTAAHEVGCGYEAQLEGWFRFLIDPVPPVLPLPAPASNNLTARIGSDDTLLNQRAAFLRPDSLVAIVPPGCLQVSATSPPTMGLETIWTSLLGARRVTAGSCASSGTIQASGSRFPLRVRTHFCPAARSTSSR